MRLTASSTLALAALCACAPTHPEPAAWADADSSSSRVHRSASADVATPEAARGDDLHDHSFMAATLVSRLAGTRDATLRHQLTLPKPARQIGFWLEGETLREGDVRVRWRTADTTAWSAWRDVALTWSDGALHVGRVLWEVDVVELELELEPGVRYAALEAYERWRTPNPEQLTRDLPAATSLPSSPGDGLQQRRQALAPAGLVVSRAEWGARHPDKVCNTVVAPYRLSVHHTALPESDGGDPAARMRQIQAYHIDNNGWCDIGYHFVVSQSGKIYQGRGDEQRPGAHVGDQNEGNIGVCFIGNYQTARPEQAQLDAAKPLFNWIRETYDVTWDRQSVRGHREWPGQSTNCPGDNLLVKLPELMGLEPGEEPKEPEEEEGGVEVGVSARWLDPMPMERVMGGSSASIPDALRGESLRAELLIRNGHDGPLRGVKLGYSVETPFLKATRYAIETDVPARDGATWMTNDADSAPENPARDGLGAGGELTLYAMGAGESKRVVVELDAAQYSIGLADHPALRVWVKQIEGAYAQEAWDATPTLQRTTTMLQAATQLDIFAPDEWQFDGGSPEDTEGWSGCESASPPRVNALEGALLLDATAQRGCALSPAWTAIDAEQWNQLVIRVRARAPQTLQVAWSSDESISESSPRVFVAVEASEALQTLVLPMDEVQAWRDVIKRVQLGVVGADGLLEIDAIYAQSSASGVTSSASEPVGEGMGVVLLSEPPPAPSPDMSSSGSDVSEGRSVCAALPGQRPARPGAIIWLGLVALFGAVRRSRRS